MALELLDLCRYHMILATKRKDPLVQDLRAHGYTVVSDLKDIQWDFEHRRPIQKKVVYWPTFPAKLTSTQRLAAQAKLMAQAMDWTDKTGGWALLIDETIWMHDTLRLHRELSQLWFQGRTQGLSVIACAQRPARVPRLAFSSARYLFIWQTSDKRDLDNLQEISAGIPRDLLEDAVRRLDARRHEALFIDSEAKELARVVAPPR